MTRASDEDVCEKRWYVLSYCDLNRIELFGISERSSFEKLFIGSSSEDYLYLKKKKNILRINKQFLNFYLESLELSAIAVTIECDSASKAGASWSWFDEFLLFVFWFWDVSWDNLDKAFSAGEVTIACSGWAEDAAGCENFEEVLVIFEFECLLLTTLCDADDWAETSELACCEWKGHFVKVKWSCCHFFILQITAPNRFGLQSMRIGLAVARSLEVRWCDNY